MVDLDDEPIGETEAEQLADDILDAGSVIFGHHVRNDKFPEHDLDEVDCRNVLRNGWVDFSEPRSGDWTYHFCSREIEIVVKFPSKSKLVIITAWRDR